MHRNEEFDVGERASVDIDCRSGAVEVRAGDNGVIRVDVRGDDADQWEISQVGDVVSAHAPTNVWGLTRTGKTTRVTVVVPLRADAEVRVVSADVVTSGELGETRIRSVSGDVRLDRVRRADVTTASGYVRIHASVGEVSCTTASGNLDVGESSGRLSTSTASGDVRAQSVLGDVHVGTASGDVRIDRCMGGDITIKTVSGDVVLGLPGGIRVEPEISTLSGRISLPPKRTAEAAAPRLVRLRLKSVSGDITVERAD
jgi:DUF4097 and DUF4098 domain-containing protein YvlB